VVTNQVKRSSTGYGEAYYNVATYANPEAYFDVPTVGVAGDEVVIQYRITTPNTSTVSGYQLEIKKQSGVDTWRIFKITNDQGEQIGADFLQELSNGDAVGIVAEGSTHTPMYKASGGSWVSLGNRTDGTYTSAGYIGFSIKNTVFVIDNFSGGQHSSSNLCDGATSALISTFTDNTTLSYTHQGLTNGTTYYYRIIADDGTNQSTPSNEDSAIPAANPISPGVSGCGAKSIFGGDKVLGTTQSFLIGVQIGCGENSSLVSDRGDGNPLDATNVEFTIQCENKAPTMASGPVAHVGGGIYHVTNTNAVASTPGDTCRAKPNGLGRFSGIIADSPVMVVAVGTEIYTVLSDAGNTATTFKTDIPDTINTPGGGGGSQRWSIRFLRNPTCNVGGIIAQASSFNTSTDFIVMTEPLPVTPGNGCKFKVLGTE
jgi:hypothetical protein